MKIRTIIESGLFYFFKAATSTSYHSERAYGKKINSSCTLATSLLDYRNNRRVTFILSLYNICKN